MMSHTTTANPRPLAPPAWLLPALLLSAVAIADNAGLILPNSYRTPLSDLVFEQQSSWRAAPADENAWRRGKVEPDSDSRIRVEVLPQYDYSEHEDLTRRNSFMNEDELARPKTNIFRYNF
jgi:hypothetical protein